MHLLPRHGPYGPAIHQDIARIHLVEPHQQVHDSGLTRTGGSDYGHLLPRLDINGESMDYLLPGGVTETDVPELHMALDIRDRFRILGILRHLLMVQEFEYALRCGCSGLEPTDRTGDHVEGTSEHLDVDDEGDDDTDSYLAVQNHQRSDYAHQEIGQMTDESRDRREETDGDLRFQTAVPQILVDVVEPCLCILFAAIGHDDPLGGIDLGYQTVHPTDVRLLTAVVPLCGPYHHDRCDDTQHG